jgi:2-dehydropantoate 2-reductase
MARIVNPTGVESRQKNRGVSTVQILVIGAGAVGGYFGGRLVQAKRDVTFLVHAKRAEEIKAKGLQIVSPHGDLTLRPKTITADRIAGPYDVILLGVKGYALSGAINDFAAAVGPETIILPVLNGMRHIDLLIARFGEHAVLGGVCLVATEIDQEGRIHQLADFQKLIYGELDGQRTPRLEKLDETLRDVGFDAAISCHIVHNMWRSGCRSQAWGPLPASCVATSARLSPSRKAQRFLSRYSASAPTSPVPADIHHLTPFLSNKPGTSRPQVRS